MNTRQPIKSFATNMNRGAEAANGRNFAYDKDISNCGLVGIISKKKEPIGGDVIMKSIALMHDRGNGQGGGFAAYGIYEEMKDYYALHVMFDSKQAVNDAEEYFKTHLEVERIEEIPTRKTKMVPSHPILKRYFVLPLNSYEEREKKRALDLTDDDLMVETVMHVNATIDGAHIVSSGKNMGAFKGVGFPEDLGEFFKLDEYEGYIWTAHNRFPTNTQGWWGGAHPFTLLDWSIVHNGEISSYGTNRRYLEQFGYTLSLHTDTEVVAYLLDLLARRWKLGYDIVAEIFSPHFWSEIDAMDVESRDAYVALRSVYGQGLLNGPFAILFAHSTGLIGLNDRIKLRPLVVATKGDIVAMASEEAAIREIYPSVDSIYVPSGGEPVIVEIEQGA